MLYLYWGENSTWWNKFFEFQYIWRYCNWQELAMNILWISTRKKKCLRYLTYLSRIEIPFSGIGNRGSRVLQWKVTNLLWIDFRMTASHQLKSPTLGNRNGSPEFKNEVWNEDLNKVYEEWSKTTGTAPSEGHPTERQEPSIQEVAPSWWLGSKNKNPQRARQKCLFLLPCILRSPEHHSHHSLLA